MTRKELIVLVLVIAGFICIPLIEYGMQKKDKPAEKIPQVIREKIAIPVKKVTVLNTSVYDVILEDDRRIKAELTVQASDSGKAEVIKLLNSVTNPKMVLLERTPDGGWFVDFIFDLDGKTVNIVDWLKERNLVFK